MNKKYTKQMLLDELHRAYDVLGRVPMASDMKKSKGFINIGSYYRYFESFNSSLIEAGFEIYSTLGCTKYSDEFLIAEINRFVKENNRSPTMGDFGKKTGYPHTDTYITRFGSWNDSLRLANVPLNCVKYNITNRICNICNTSNSKTWRFLDDKLVCHKCYRARNLIQGTLSPTSTAGKGLLSEYIVSMVLDDCIKCNTDIVFNYKYDLISKKYGTINVKASKLGKSKSKNSYHWHFVIRDCSEIPDHYIFLALDADWTEIQHVWIIPSKEKLVKKTCTLTLGKLKKASKFEVDNEQYNKVYQELDIYSLPEFRNLNYVDDITQEIL